jgi:c-di-GMP-related signal transduction protein
LLDQAVDGLGNDALQEKTETIIKNLKVALIDWVDENYKKKISNLQSIKDALQIATMTQLKHFLITHFTSILVQRYLTTTFCHPSQNTWTI